MENGAWQNLNRLFCGNCVSILREMPEKSIDLVVTDPPYKLIGGGRADTPDAPSGILRNNDKRLFAYNDISAEEWLPEVYRVMKNDTQIYVMTNYINLIHFIKVMEQTGFRIHNLLVWEKNNCTPSRWYMKNAEYVIFGRKGAAKSINNIGSKTVHTFNNIIGNKLHPAEKPVELMRYYIENSSFSGDTVLDPFMGAGSVGVACEDANRNFIGIEIDREYFDIAQSRLQKGVISYG